MRSYYLAPPASATFNPATSTTWTGQAMSIYGKLGVSSRSQAIQHAQQLGLLPA
jgi:hypothetical protein